MPRTSPATTLRAAIAAAALLLAGCAPAATTVVVTHDPVPDPVVVRAGVEGTSVGDTRYFDIEALADGAPVRLLAVMVTTAVNEGTTDELRDTTLTFTFGDLDDQVIVEGIGLYPGKGSTIAPATTVQRAIVGGSGKYAGATGWAESVHEADGSWTHTLHLE